MTQAQNIDLETGEVDTKLKRSIGTWLLFFFIVGDTLGAGIYTLVGQMANDVGGVLWLPLLIALVPALLTAGVYAELITKYPRAGGAARFAERAFNKPYITFMIGFLMLASGFTISAVLAKAFAGPYLAALIDFPQIPAMLIFIAILVAINLRGVKESMSVNVVATLIEVSGLVIIIVVAGMVIQGGGGDMSRITTFNPDVAPLTGAFAASIIAFFSFLGFESAANMAEEVKNPTRAYPRALFGAIMTAGIVYLLIAVGAGAVVPTDVLAESTGPLLEVINFSGIAFPPQLFALIALVAIANGALLFMIMASRATYGLAEAGLLPSVFGRVLKNRRTPWAAILTIGIITAAMGVVGEIDILAAVVVLLLLIVYITAAISCIKLRKDKVAHKHFTVPLIVPILALITAVVLLAQQPLETWLIAGAYVAVGSILYFIAKYVRKAEINTDAIE